MILDDLSACLDDLSDCLDDLDDLSDCLDDLDDLSDCLDDLSDRLGDLSDCLADLKLSVSVCVRPFLSVPPPPPLSRITTIRTAGSKSVWERRADLTPNPRF